MKFYLDNNLIQDEPSGNITTTIKRDSQLGGFLITNDAKLKWEGDGFDYIQSVIESEGFCGEIDCRIDDECNGERVNIFGGKIFILEIEKSSNCIITAPLQDNSFHARINKNRSIEVSIDTVTSKNGVAIAAAKENDMTMFAPSTGLGLASTRRGWRAYDIFTNLVAFMSDGEVEFDSQLFGLTGEFGGLSFTTGQELSFPTTGEAIKTSFAKFFDEVKKKINVTIYIDTTGVKPVLRIESYNDLFTDTIVKRLENIESIKYKVDTDKLISIISVGSDKVTDVAVGGGVSFVESNVYQTFKTEDYTTLGQCNKDAKLDLVSSFVISSNTIEDCLINGAGANYSTDIFFIDCDTVVDAGTSYTSIAKRGDPFGVAPPYFYNIRLFNSEVLARWSRLIPNSITSFQGSVNNEFRASNTGNIIHAFFSYTTYFPYQFNDDFSFPNFDSDGTQNLYGNGTAQGSPVSQANSRFTCPVAGQYIVYHQFKVTCVGTTATVAHGFIVRTAANVQKGGSGTVDTVIGNPNTSIILTHQATFNCVAGDYIETDLTINVVGTLGGHADIIGATGETFFACTTAPDNGGTFVHLQNQNIVPIIKGDFEYKILNSDFYDILANPFGKIGFTYANKVKAGHIDTLQFNHITTDTKITLLGSKEFLT